MYNARHEAIESKRGFPMMYGSTELVAILGTSRRFRDLLLRESGRALGVLVVTSAVVHSAGCGRAPAGDPPRPTVRNVVVILIDTLRQDHLGAYGYDRDTSPVLDRLAADGARLHAVSPTSWTKPATASLLTGVHPLRHQAYGREDVLPQEMATLAEILGDLGLSTYGVSANMYITDKWGFDQGFDVFRDMGKLRQEAAADCGSVNIAVGGILDSIAAPFFLYVHYVDPHLPYDPPYRWDGRPLNERQRSLTPMEGEVLSALSLVPRDPQLVQDAVDLYDGEIRDVDARVGELLAELEGRGLMSSTLTVVTADHGEEFEDHGRMSHGHTVYSELSHVPLILHAPGVIAPGQVVGTVSLMDVFPTVLDLLGHEQPPDLDGLSLAPTVRDGGPPPGSPDRPLLVHLDYDTGVGLAMVSQNRELIVTRQPYVKSLFDLETDPEEQFPKAAIGPWREHFAELADVMVDEHNRLRGRAVPRQTRVIDDETAADLAALGYIDVEGVGQERRIPEVIAPPDPLDGGLTGWEKHIVSCIVPGREDADEQLLKGWYPGKPRPGRWTFPEATVALKMPSAARGILSITGFNHRHDRPTLSVSVGDEKLIERVVRSGRFELSGPVELGRRGGTVILRLDTDPPFYPAQHGREDRRTLGLYITGICLE